MRLVLLVAAVVAAAVFLVAASSLVVDGGILQTFTMSADADIPSAEESTDLEGGEPTSRMVEIRPDSLQRGSEGEPVAAYVRPTSPLSDQHPVTDIRLCLAPEVCVPGILSYDTAPTPFSTGGGETAAFLFAREDVLRLTEAVPTPSTAQLRVIWKEGEESYIGFDSLAVVEAPTEKVANPAESPAEDIDS